MKTTEIITVLLVVVALGSVSVSIIAGILVEVFKLYWFTNWPWISMLVFIIATTVSYCREFKLTLNN